MITVPTHKHQKIPFKHSKTIYVFTSGRVIVIVQIQSRKKKRFKGLKWPLQKEPSILESSRICPILLQDLMKRGVCECGGGDALSCNIEQVQKLQAQVLKNLKIYPGHLLERLLKQWYNTVEIVNCFRKSTHWLMLQKGKSTNHR
jgi:hypothetical protein